MGVTQAVLTLKCLFSLDIKQSMTAIFYSSCATINKTSTAKNHLTVFHSGPITNSGAIMKEKRTRKVEEEKIVHK